MRLTEARELLSATFVEEKALQAAFAAVLDRASENQRRLFDSLPSLQQWPYVRALADRLITEEEASRVCTPAVRYDLEGTARRLEQAASATPADQCVGCLKPVHAWANPCMECVQARARAAFSSRCTCGRKRRESEVKRVGSRTFTKCLRCLGTARQLS